MNDVSNSSGSVIRYAMAGKPIVCPHCGSDAFDCRKALINTRGATFFNLDWLNRGSFALTCMVCSRIEWFRREPEPRN